MAEVWMILLMTSLACSILGVFLVLRRLAMMTDAISHSVLLGITLGYFLTKDIDSIFLVIFATAFGVLTGYAIELLIKSKRVGEDAATGIVFPLFFSIAVILITKYARNVHLDVEIVLSGEVILAPFHRMELFGLSVPRALAGMIPVLAANILFVMIFFRKLKISSFDPVFAATVGISGVFLYYAFMTMVSLTAVFAFSSVGAILTISFFAAPAASACLVTKDLRFTLILSAIYAIINTCIGFVFAIGFNVSVSGMCATVSGITFMLTMCYIQWGKPAFQRHVSFMKKKIRGEKCRGRAERIIFWRCTNWKKNPDMPQTRNWRNYSESRRHRFRK